MKKNEQHIRHVTAIDRRQTTKHGMVALKKDTKGSTAVVNFGGKSNQIGGRCPSVDTDISGRCGTEGRSQQWNNPIGSLFSLAVCTYRSNRVDYRRKLFIAAVIRLFLAVAFVASVGCRSVRRPVAHKQPTHVQLHAHIRLQVGQDVEPPRDLSFESSSGKPTFGTFFQVKSCIARAAGREQTCDTH